MSNQEAVLLAVALMSGVVISPLAGLILATLAWGRFNRSLFETSFIMACGFTVSAVCAIELVRLLMRGSL